MNKKLLNWAIDEDSSGCYYIQHKDIIIFFDSIRWDNTLFTLYQKGDVVCQMHWEENWIVDIDKYRGLVIN